MTPAPAAALAVLLSCAPPALAGWGALTSEPPAEDPALRRIVVFSPATAPADRAAAVTRAGGRVLKNLKLITAVAAAVPDARLAALRAEPGVVRVDQDLTVEAAVVRGSGKPSGGGTTPPPPQQVPWGLARLRAPEAWPASVGAGVKVAVLDTGVDPAHPDLAANVKGGVNTISPAKGYKDDNGHGTHVSGTIAAANDAFGVVGAGPGIHLYAVKVLSRSGSGFLSDIIEGLQWAAANGMRVVNMSLGSSSDNASFREAVVAAHGAGIVLVAAAGNSSGGAVSYPARYPEVIAVSASNQGDGLASFSSVGPEVDVIAPGADILSTYPGGAYAAMSGTSMASPHVAGAAALKLAQDPALTPPQVAERLAASAAPLPGLSAAQQGAGLVDAQKLAFTP